VYRPLATNLAPSSIIIDRTSSPLLSMTVTLVEIDDPIACRRTIPSGLPVRDQFCYAVFSQPTLKDPSLYSIDLLHRNP
jgi:hypothetical protein